MFSELNCVNAMTKLFIHINNKSFCSLNWTETFYKTTTNDDDKCTAAQFYRKSTYDNMKL